jgi:hypothetical protein
MALISPQGWETTPVTIKEDLHWTSKAACEGMHSRDVQPESGPEAILNTLSVQAA